MKSKTFALVAAAAALSATVAAAQNFQAPGNTPFKALSAMLAIKSPATNACPTEAKMAIWIMTNKPGAVSYMVARKGGSVSGPFQVNAVPAAGGAMATVNRIIPIVQAVDAEYRVLVADGTGKVMSNWVRLRASCKIQLGG